MRRVTSFLAWIAPSWCAIAGDLDTSKASLGSVQGVVKFTSDKHGTVLVPADLFLTPP